MADKHMLRRHEVFKDEDPAIPVVSSVHGAQGSKVLSQLLDIVGRVVTVLGRTFYQELAW